ncbi:MAG: lipase family alpha/beta hydrolase [Wenzhouxiangella sp.]
MSAIGHLRPSDLHGLSRLSIDGVLGTTELVEQMHYAIGRVAGPSLPSRNGRTRGITGLVYRSIYGITGLVGATADLAFGQIVPRLKPAQSTPQRDRMLAVLNGVLGDHLEASKNPLALTMSLRHNGQPLSPAPDLLAAQLPQPRRKIAVFLHGLCMNDRHWTPAGDAPGRADLPRLLSATAGYLPLHLRYNTGRRISQNGRDFADQLEALLKAWPGPVDELVLIGHSMGGLVARSACHQAEASRHAWVTKTRRLITLGSPHHGAPLERIGHLVDRSLALTPFSRPFARLGAIRSAGILDLRHGNLVDADRQQAGRLGSARDRRVPLTLPVGLQLFTLGACLGESATEWRARVLGDGLVPVASALGRHPDPDHPLQLAPAAQQILQGVGHLDLPTRAEAAQIVLGWLEGDAYPPIKP